MFSRLFILLFALCLSLSLAGCGKDRKTEAAEGTTFRWASFPVDLYADAAILNDADAEADLRDAMSFWETRAGKPLFRLNGEWTSGPAFSGSAGNPDEIFTNIIFFQNPWPFDSGIAGQTILHSEDGITQKAIILLNQGTTVCLRDCSQPGDSSKTSFRKLVAHELGHFIGFSHTSDAKDVMFPEIQTGGTLDDLQINAATLQHLVR